MIFYTEGVTEARDPAGRFYPLDERAALLKDPDPEAALRSVREDLVEHVEGPLHDDAAMLLVRYRTAHGDDGPRSDGGPV
jgi:serine phosphatase RsbU (regulator of sigma subunit)